MKRTVRSVLREKSSEAVWSVAPDATVFEAIQRMAEASVGALVVLEAGQVKGIVSERDYTRKVALHDRASKSTRVHEIMAHPAICVNPDCTVDECMALMTQRRVRHLPVLEGERLTGLVSIGDVVKAVIEDKGILIDQLERYIAGHS